MLFIILFVLFSTWNRSQYKNRSRNSFLYFDIDCCLLSTDKPSLLHVDIETDGTLSKAAAPDVGLVLAVHGLQSLDIGISVYLSVSLS